MKRPDVRLKKARELADKAGGVAEFARRMGMSDSQASQIIGKTPSRRIGDKMAARIEHAFELEPGQLDRTQDDSSTKQHETHAEEGISVLIDEIHQVAANGALTPDVLQAIRSVLRLAMTGQPTAATSPSQKRISGRGSVASAQDAEAHLERALDVGENRGTNETERTPRRKRG
ncbi:hypothetical protein [Burkholderia cenocepacia]|uniref:hypothetical protein n=1 Tax=Burkholderia cenocepacia TaxID=95486 RepID=UPI002AB18C5A|nr:hypothetical protein [Burkholderia cenocepacia]